MGGVSLREIAAEVGTPCYVYSRAAVESAAAEWREAFAGAEHGLCYSVKANSSLAILRLLAEAGWDFDIVSGGELELLLHLGIEPARVRFSGVGKTRDELMRALEVGVGALHLESAGEARLLHQLAEQSGRLIDVAVRVNPDTSAGGSDEISTARAQDKFGVPLHEAGDLYRWLAQDSRLRPTGIAFHLGSQIQSAEPYAEAIGKAMRLVEELRHSGISLKELDVGGGAAVASEGCSRLAPAELAKTATVAAKGLRLVLSPGRSLVAAAGALLTRTLYCKNMAGRQILIVDAAMNDYPRSSLYGVQPPVEPVCPPQGDSAPCDLAGPVCESTDFFARDVELPQAEGTLLALLDTGAYGMSMSSNYNSRPRPPEVLVEDGGWRLVRRRETPADLLATQLEPGRA